MVYMFTIEMDCGLVRSFSVLRKTCVEDSSHAFYLRVELARAEIAWSLGKRYAQDRGLDWGAAAEPRREDALTHCQPKIKKKLETEKIPQNDL